MSIKRTIITAIVGLTLVAVVAPGVAQGTTIDDLLAQIAQLQSQLVALQGNTTTSGSVPAACAGVTFSRNLTVGATGADVKCLQTLLNTSASTRVATTGAGSPGAETTYFGSRTLVAVKVYQQQQGFTPANQVGPMTRAKLNAWISGGVVIIPGQPPVVPTGAGLTVMLASNNPASGTIVDGQALYPLTRLTFVNGDNAEVKITGLKLKRIGVSADASLVNTYLFDGVTRLTDGSAVSSTVINFNNSSGLFTVPAGSSRTISILADVNGSSSETFGIQVVASTDVTTNASSVRGSFPVTGNLHTLASGTLAGVEFNATTSPSSAATIIPQNDYTVWQNSVVVTTRAVDMTRISFRKTGSVKDADMQNFKLYVDGVQVGSAVPNIVLNANNESLVTFDLSSSPKRLEAGTRVIKLLSDIIGGSSLKFTYNLWNSADATFVDTQYLANVLPDLISDATFTKRSSAEMTIDSGTITITKMSDSPSGNIVNTASNALLAKFQFKAAGERVKIENLYISANVNTAAVSGLRNGAIYANGVQIGSTTTLYDPADSSYDYTTFNLGSSLIVDPATPVVLEVRADIYDTGTSDTTNSIVANSTIQVTIEGSSAWNNGTGMTSASTVDVPATDVSANTLTVKEGSVVLSNYPAFTAQAVVAPFTDTKIAHYTLTANTTEAVNITNINVTVDEVSSYMSNLYVKYGTAAEVSAGTTKSTTIKSTVSTASQDWPVNLTLAAGQTIHMMVYADVSSLMTTGTGTVTMTTTGTTVSSAATANSSEVTGQALSYTSGTFAEAFASTPVAQIVAGNQTITAAKYQLTSSYQTYTVSEMRFSVGSDTIAGAILSATLKEGSTVLATVAYDSASDYFNFTGLNVAIPASTTKTLTLEYALSTPSATAGTSNVDVKPTLTYVKRMDPNGTVTEDSPLTYAANSTIVYKSIPVLSLNALPTTTLANTAEAILADVNVKASKGDISIKQFKFAVSWSDAATLAVLNVANMKLFRNGTDITTSVSIVSEDGYSAEGSGGISESDGTVVITWDSNTADSISAEETVRYALYGTPTLFKSGATDTTTDAISFALTRDSAAQTASHNYLNLNDGTIIGLHDSAVSVTSAAEEATFIWSDMSAVGHSAGSTAGTVGTSSANDWSNSYLVEASLSSQVREAR